MNEIYHVVTGRSFVTGNQWHLAPSENKSALPYLDTFRQSFSDSSKFNFRISTKPIPVAERSKAWVCSRSPARIAGSNPTGGMFVCCDCCVLSGRGLCDGPIPRPEESYRLW